MKKTLIFLTSIVIVLSFTLNSQAGGDMKFPIQISYVGGLGDVYDLYIDNLEDDGYIVDSKFYVPIAISFHPFYEFDFGLRIGGGVGPIMLVYVSGPNVSYFDLPLNFHVGYTIIPKSPVSPFVKTGFAYHVNTGEYLKSSTPGLLLAGGVDFLRTKKVSFGFEVAKDFSEATFEDYTADSYNYETGRWEDGEKKINTGGLTIGIFVRF